MLPMWMPAAIACSAPGTSAGPYTGCRMMPSYFPEAIASWSCWVWVCGLRLPSKTVRLALPAAAAALAAASIGAS